MGLMWFKTGDQLSELLVAYCVIAVSILGVVIAFKTVIPNLLLSRELSKIRTKVTGSLCTRGYLFFPRFSGSFEGKDLTVTYRYHTAAFFTPVYFPQLIYVLIEYGATAPFSFTGAQAAYHASLAAEFTSGADVAVELAKLTQRFDEIMFSPGGVVMKKKVFPLSLSRQAAFEEIDVALHTVDTIIEKGFRFKKKKDAQWDTKYSR